MNEGTINAEVTMGGAVGVLLVNRYRVLKQLGQGGMGSVWLAEDTKLDGRKVAVKMLPSILVSNKRAYAQVKQEALVSLKLMHPNIVAVRAFEEESGNPFLVMDYIEGRTLDDYLAEKGKLSEEETIRLLKPIAAALDYAHAQGVVHRDVKPGNIMIRKDGTPFVLDFGIAREIQETMTRVTGKLSSGTLLYMSPEQLNGDAPKSAQDIYSFAAVAYECLKGELPFSRGGVEDQIKHKLPEPLGPQFIKCGLGVMAGLAKSPEARPATCVAVLSDRSRIPCDRADHGTFVGRSWIVSVLMGVLVLAVLAGIGGWWLWKAQEDVEAVQRAEIARQQEGFRHLKEERRIADERCVAAKKRIAEGGKAAAETPVVDEGRTTKAKRMQSVEENCIAKETESERVVEEGRSACFRTVIDTCEVHGIVAISGKRYNSPVKCEKLRKGTAIGKICAAYERGRGLSATCCRQMRKGGKIYFEGRMEQRTVDWAGEKCIDVALTPYVLPFYTKGTDCVEGRTRVMFSLLGGEDFEVVCGEAIGRTGYKLKTWFYRQIIVPDTTFGGNPRRVQKKAQCVFVVIREEDGLEVAFEDGEGGCILGVRGGFANVKDDEGAFGKSMLDIVREGKYREYVVKRGDTLGGIAYGNGITIRQLKELNGLSGDLPCLGQVLKIPIQNSGTRNLSECSQESMTLESEQDGCQLIEYIVQSGDYLAKISKKLNVSISDLRRMNPVLKHDVVRVGQVLKVPKSCKRR